MIDETFEDEVETDEVEADVEQTDDATEEDILGATPAEEAPEEPEAANDGETPYQKYERLLAEGYKRSQLRSICNGKGTLIAVELA